MRRHRARWPRISRDAILFTAGLLGIAHETLLGHADRPTLLFLFATMVGLPAFLRQDEKGRRMRRPDDDGDDPAPPLPPQPKPLPRPNTPVRSRPRPKR